MKKVLFSLGTIVVVAVAVVGATGAFFNDTETSTDNIFTAGSIDLQVDHLKQTYNGVDCQTCTVEVVSDTTNQVVATTGGDDPVPFPHAAEEVTFIHDAWTANIPGATWIWATDPVTENDVENDVYYTFRKEFTWFGPLDGATIEFSLGADNSYEVYLNGELLDQDTAENNHAAGTQDTISIDSSDIEQGVNVLEFVVQNWAQPNGDAESNPAGLLYKLTIDGDCEDSHFLNHCSLFGETDLTDETFFHFNDIKPGDYGTNVISLHVYDNDAWSCLLAHDGVDDENTVYESEGDDDDTAGELQDYINFFAWLDENGDGEYDDVNEEALGFSTLGDLSSIASLDSETDSFLTATSTEYIGLAWCAGNLDPETLECDGSGMLNDAQSDSFSASLTAYAEQTRNNEDFKCADVDLGGGDDDVVFEFQNNDQDSPGLNDYQSEQSTGEGYDEPWVEWTINGDEIDFTFHNPTPFLFVFDVRVDGDAGEDRSTYIGIPQTDLIEEGPLENQQFGPTYDRVVLSGNTSTTTTVSGTSAIEVGLREGAEQHWYFDWLTFLAN